jgi:hypothetical protein
VHLTFDSLHQQRPEITWGQVAEALGPELLANRVVLLQQGQSAALLRNGRQLASWDAEKGGGPAKMAVAVRLQHVAPCCAVAGQPVQLLLSGAGLDAPGIKLHARHQGRFLQVSPAPEASAPAVVASTSAAAGAGSEAPGAESADERPAGGQAAAGGPEAVGRRMCLPVELQPVPSPGLVWLEVEQDQLMSRAVALLVLPDAEMAAELLLLEWALGPEKVARVSCWLRSWPPCRAWLCIAASLMSERPSRLPAGAAAAVAAAPLAHSRQGRQGRQGRQARP